MQERVVVVGADFAETGDNAIRAGLHLLGAGAAQTLHVVHLLDVSQALLPPEEPTNTPKARTKALMIESLSRRVDTLAQLDRVEFQEGQVHIEVRHGDVLTGLLAAIRLHRADLAIVGTHGREGLDRWLVGSIAERLVRSAECSVLVARLPRVLERPDECENDTRTAREHERPKA